MDDALMLFCLEVDPAFGRAWATYPRFARSVPSPTGYQSKEQNKNEFEALSGLWKIGKWKGYAWH
jgi:hypothetical protein